MNVLAALVKRRLLVVDDGTVELVHEALLQQWPRLVAWLEDDAQGRRLHRHLTLAASEWETAGRESSELYRGPRLAATLEWADADDSGTLNRVEGEFLDESRAAATREVARQRRANRRLRGLLAAALALLLAAIAGGAVASTERGTRAEPGDRGNRATPRRPGTREPRLDRSLLLAREGVNLDGSLATRSNLLAALLRAPAALAVLRGAGERILDDALSPTGRLLAARSDDGSVTLFDTRTLAPVGLRFARPGTISYCGAIVRPVRGIAFSPNGGTLAVSDADRKLSAFLLDAGTQRARTALRDRSAVIPTSRSRPPAARCSPARPSPRRRSARRGDRRAQDPDGHELRRSQVIGGGRLVGLADHGRSLLVTSGDEVAPPRRAQPQAGPDVPDLRRGGGFPLGRTGCVRKRRWERGAPRPPDGRAATDGQAGSRARARARVQPERAGACDHLRRRHR